MNLNLANKVAIVTGASRGIGRSIAEALSQESMRLVLAARSGDLLQEVAQSCNAEAKIFAADLRDENAPQKLVALAMEKFGRIDLLVNNAGQPNVATFSN